MCLLANDSKNCVPPELLSRGHADDAGKYALLVTCPARTPSPAPGLETGSFEHGGRKCTEGEAVLNVRAQPRPSPSETGLQTAVGLLDGRAR